MTERRLPRGAATPDELLAAAQDPGLSETERAEIADWLDAHPAWRGRAAGYDAMRTALQSSPATDAPPPIATMAELWAAIDGDRRTRPRPVGSLALPAPAPPVPLAAVRARRRRPGWLAAAAALLLVVAAGAVVLIDRVGDDGDLATESGPAATAGSTGATVADAAEAPTAAPDDQVAALAQLRQGADRTARMGTALIIYRSLATADVSDGELGELTGENTVNFETVGRGQLALPDRSILTTATTTRVGDRTDLFPELRGVTVTNGPRTFVRCEGEADFVETTERDETDCFATGVRPDSFGPDVALEVINRESFARAGLARLGTDTMSDGTVITGYQSTEPVTLDDGETVEVTLQVWLDGDQYIRRLVSGADFSAGDAGYPTNLVISYELFDLGTDVDIPEMD